MKKLLFIFLLFLGACGFSPLYKEVMVSEESVSVKVDPIPDEYGVSMRKIIQGKMGISEKPLYTLIVSAPSFSSWDQTIDSKNFATMMEISGVVSYKLVENKTKKVILSSSTSLSGSYSVVKDPYATTVAERKVKKELAEQLADQVSIHVLGALSGVRK